MPANAHRVGKVLRFLGRSVGAITGTNQVKSLGQRMFDREQFLKDVTYTTALELGFSFLMDQIADSPSSLVRLTANHQQLLVVVAVPFIQPLPFIQVLEHTHTPPFLTRYTCVR